MRKIGQAELRREDGPLLRGVQPFAGDHHPPGLCHLQVIRSHFPHARLDAVDLQAVRAHHGVLGAWSAADVSFPAIDPFPMPGLDLRPRPILAEGEVRYVGEPVAFLVADDAYTAADAAADAELELEPLGATAAASQGEPAGHLRREFGDVEVAFGAAAVTVRTTLELERVSGGYLEPRAVTAEPVEGGVRVHTSTQWAHGVRDTVAKCLELDPECVHVLAPAVGGAFGAKGMAYPEEVHAAFAAHHLGRPVRWTATRTEDLLATAQSHGTLLELELAANVDGTLRGLRGSITHPIGAYAATGPGQADNIGSHLLSAYRLPALAIDIDLVYTNTVPTGFIRGGGREVGNFAIERLLDLLADDVGISRIEVRRRNLLQPDAMPHDTGYRSSRGVYTYDSGNYPQLLETVLTAVGGEDAMRPGANAKTGLGVACFCESTGMGMPEMSRVRLDPDGWITVFVGTTPQGQGHETVGAQVAADVLDWPLDRVRVVAGDSRAVPAARNTAASRSAVEMGNAVGQAATALRSRLVEIAAESLESASRDVVVTPDGAGVEGVPELRLSLPALVPAGLEITETYDPKGTRPYASGCAAAAVSVDVETGTVDVERYVFAHDVGRAINPMIVEGQAQGGIAHGLGYALFEEVVFDEEAIPRTSNFLDYTIPGMPDVLHEPEISHGDVRSTNNPLGFRGAGEGGTIPVPAAIASAVEDSLRRQGFDVTIQQLPITPLRLLELIANARAGKSA